MFVFANIKMDDFATFLKQQKFPCYIRLRIVPGASKSQIVALMDDGETWKCQVAAAPEKGKANAELKKFFRKQFGISAEVISGATDRTKLVKLEK